MTTNVFRIFFVSLVLSPGCANPLRMTLPATLDQADTAYAKLNLDLSRQVLEALLQDPAASAEDKVLAEQRLARQDWKFYKNLSAARTRLTRATAQDIKQFQSWMILSRIEREAGNFSNAKQAAERAEQSASSPSRKKDAWVSLASAVLQQAIVSQVESGDYDRQALSEASARLSTILEERPGHPTASTLLLAVALLLDDGPVALRAWRSYYHIPDAQSATGLMRESGEALDKLLSNWRGRDLTRREQEKLVFALSQSRFFRYAALVARKPHADDSVPLTDLPQIAEIVAYSDFLHAVAELTNEFYRLTALGKESKSAFVKQYREAARALRGKLYIEGKQSASSSRPFHDELERRFGAYVNFGFVGGYYGMGFGHRVSDETRVLSQYGHEAKLRFVALDFMVSNYYTSWFWDGKAAVGGWSKPEAIYQVKSAYADNPLQAWRAVTDPEQRGELEKEIADRRVSDDALAAKTPHAYLPGLDNRLSLLSLDRLLESVRAKGYQGPQLQLAFLAEYERITWEYSIFAHEGRHAIDEIMHPIMFNLWGRATREFRAKLSEIAFAEDPQMAFRAVLRKNIGDRTGHGRANERVVKGIVKWMNAHREEIAGLDADRPLLPQFDRLTFEQIRAAVRSMDPLAS